MSMAQWKEIVKIAFVGERFRDHALDLTALAELSQFQKMVAETAKVLWRLDNPNRERLPAHFEQRTRLCLRRIDEGSAVAPLEVYIEEPPQPELFEREPLEVMKATDLVHGVFRALEEEEPLPPNFPRALVAEYQRWGQGLAEDEAMEIVTPGRPRARVTPVLRARLDSFVEATYEDQVDMIGEVLEADVRVRRFQLWVDERTGIPVTFSAEQEDEVTRALRDHHTVRLQVKGKGEFSPQGTPTRICEVSELTLAGGEETFDATARDITDILAELAGQVPPEEWDRLPGDLSENLDNYLYGTRGQ